MTPDTGKHHRSYEAGNFYKESASIATPYTVVVRAPNGTVTAMVTPQTVTDCNTCHGEMGSEGAPGRIFVTQ